MITCRVYKASRSEFYSNILIAAQTVVHLLFYIKNLMNSSSITSYAIKSIAMNKSTTISAAIQIARDVLVSVLHSRLSHHVNFETHKFLFSADVEAEKSSFNLENLKQLTESFYEDLSRETSISLWDVIYEINASFDKEILCTRVLNTIVYIIVMMVDENKWNKNMICTKEEILNNIIGYKKFAYEPVDHYKYINTRFYLYDQSKIYYTKEFFKMLTDQKQELMNFRDTLKFVVSLNSEMIILYKHVIDLNEKLKNSFEEDTMATIKRAEQLDNFCFFHSD
ncbi:Maph56 [Matsumuraeses phaseoli granulovirus]|uniref:Maph56 n=1 Tax=Matsumuraeses phaseoli granulovirus TaxID=2760664 RepID=A0AAE7MLD2_9BBAC|nr:Maph56 [Matsumuraeses phaseoli granulovirus]QOD40019.1 Maph56 [Matsumuraeses phaseoli granulovirus]